MMTESQIESMCNKYRASCSVDEKSFEFVEEYNDNCNYLADPMQFKSFIPKAIEKVVRSFMWYNRSGCTDADIKRSIIYLADTMMSESISAKRNYLKDSYEILDISNQSKLVFRKLQMLTIEEVYTKMINCDNDLSKLDPSDISKIAFEIVNYMHKHNCVMNPIQLSYDIKSDNATAYVSPSSLNVDRYKIMYRDIETGSDHIFYIKSTDVKKMVSLYNTILKKDDNINQIFNCKIPLFKLAGDETTESFIYIVALKGCDFKEKNSKINMKLKGYVELNGVFSKLIKTPTAKVFTMFIIFINALYYLSGRDGNRYEKEKH